MGRRSTRVIILAAVFSMVFSFFSLSSMTAYAEVHETLVAGRVYEFDEKNHYEYSTAETYDEASADNTYGQLSVWGDIASTGTEGGFVAYGINGNAAEFKYSYADDLLNADEESWHLVGDKSKQVDDVKLDSNIGKGSIIVQSSKDNKTWFTDTKVSNAFAESYTEDATLYTANSVQLSNGCYYRVIVAYETAMKAGQNNGVLGTGLLKQDTYDYQRYAEVYEFYLYDINSRGKEDKTQTQALGELTNTGTGNGYSGHNDIGIKDVHYNWQLGQFFVSGYTRAAKDDDGTPVFLKNVGDQVVLWFNLEQDIEKLHDNENLSINGDKDGYDQYFQIEKTDFGKGTLIIRYTDEKGVKHTPELYTNYLSANASTSADTIVKLFEEGDYEVALDYEVKNTPRKVGSIEVVPEYSDYRISFKFSVRNGSCMVYPFDVKTGDELSDEAITPNGFKLDMAKSRYLTIDVKKAVVTQGANGFVEDVRFNRPAKDGDDYTDEGIYTFNVRNLYTKENTTKTIYVGESNYMRALSFNKISVDELNSRIAAGGSIADDGSIVMPAEEPETDEAAATEAEANTEVEDQEAAAAAVRTEAPAADNPTDAPKESVVAEDQAKGSSPVIPIAVVAALVITGGAAYGVSKKKKGNSTNKGGDEA